MPNSHASDETENAVEAPERDLATELDQLDDRYKRALADLDNYRKRAAREVDRRVADSTEAVIRDWLDVVDSVERALLVAEPDSPLAVGLRALHDQVESVLQRQGVTRLGAEREPFDPERHEAIGVVATSKVPDRTVLEVVRSGFAIGDRVLRPAEVIVARKEGED